MKTLLNIFLKGLLVVVPLLITFGLLYWLLMTAEQALRVPLEALLPTGWYLPGMGIISIVLIIFLCGILVQNYLTKPLFRFMEWILERIPLVNTLYGSARDLMHFAVGDKSDDMKKVVTVEVSRDVHLMGFVTNENITIGEQKELLAVFFPMSYQMGGYLAYVPKDKCVTLDMPVDKAMQQILTAHMSDNNTSSS